MGLLLSRIASLLVVLGLAITALVSTGGDPRVLFVCTYFLLPLALIWCPDEMGSYIGSVPYGRVTHESPPVLLAIAGWFFLIGMPAIVFW